VLGSSPTDGAQRQYVTSYLVNGSVAIDAGCLGFCGTPGDQESVRHVFLTHAHADHVASLPIFVENAWTASGPCPVIHGSAETLDGVQRHIFNDVIWSDFVALSNCMPPFMELCALENEVPVDIGELRVTPVFVNHLIPTFGFVVSDGASAVIFGGDSGATSRIWEVAYATPSLKAVFLEASFPNSMKRLAEESLHLTPEMFGAEVAKIPSGIRIIAVHLKVRYRAELIRELNALGLPDLEIGECEKEYLF
jgi:ribonuclease BN (tRNA processing enzyme)